MHAGEGILWAARHAHRDLPEGRHRTHEGDPFAVEKIGQAAKLVYVRSGPDVQRAAGCQRGQAIADQPMAEEGRKHVQRTREIGMADGRNIEGKPCRKRAEAVNDALWRAGGSGGHKHERRRIDAKRAAFEVSCRRPVAVNQAQRRFADDRPKPELCAGRREHTAPLVGHELGVDGHGNGARRPCGKDIKDESDAVGLPDHDHVARFNTGLDQRQGARADVLPDGVTRMALARAHIDELRGLRQSGDDGWKQGCRRSFSQTGYPARDRAEFDCRILALSARRRKQTTLLTLDRLRSTTSSRRSARARTRYRRSRALPTWFSCPKQQPGFP